MSEIIKFPYERARDIVYDCDDEFECISVEKLDEHRWTRDVLYVVRRNNDGKLFGAYGQQGLTETCDCDTFDRYDHNVVDPDDNILFYPVEEKTKTITYYDIIK